MDQISKDNKSNNHNEESRKYTLKKGKTSHNILIMKNNDKIIIKSRQYQLVSDLEYFIKATNTYFDSIDEIYNFIIDFFEEKRAFIKEVSNNKMTIMILIFDNEINITLPFNDLIPDDLISENITYDSFSFYNYDDSFLIFWSTYNTLNLVYATLEKTIKCFNLLDNTEIIEIKDDEKDIKYITNFRHFFDKNNKRDLIMSIISIQNKIKIWDANKWDLIVSIKDIYKKGNIFSSCFINDINDVYVISSNCSMFDNSKPLKVFDLNGNFIKEINKSHEKTYFIGVYFDINQSKQYIIEVNKDNLKSFDYEQNELYNKYTEIKDSHLIKNFDGYHYNYAINNFEDVTQLIDSADDGFLRIWNFHDGTLIRKIDMEIQSSDKCIFSLCLWNENYLFGSCEDHQIKLIDLGAGVVIKNLIGHTNTVCAVKKIIHPIYGECLISGGFKKDQIRIWKKEE